MVKLEGEEGGIDSIPYDEDHEFSITKTDAYFNGAKCWGYHITVMGFGRKDTEDLMNEILSNKEKLKRIQEIVDDVTGYGDEIGWMASELQEVLKNG